MDRRVQQGSEHLPRNTLAGVPRSSAFVTPWTGIDIISSEELNPSINFPPSSDLSIYACRIRSLLIFSN
jgi:hypothetical protein